jgi:hypothetical protein
MTRTMYDAAYPPPDPHLDVCAFYIGGDTPHVWSGAEIAGQSARWRLPIYTCDNPGQRNGAADGAEAAAWLRAHNVPAGCAVALDYETAINAEYIDTFDAAVRAAGWTTLLYGSLSSVTQNPRPSAGYWTASWTLSAHLDSAAAATQWASDTQLGKPYDLSEVSDTLVLWDTQAPAPQEDTDMTPDQANTLDQISNAIFFGGSSTGDVPPGYPNNSLVHKADFTNKQLEGLAAAVAALQAPAVDPAALAAAVTTALQTPAVVQAVAAAVVAQIGTDLKNG